MVNADREMSRPRIAIVNTGEPLLGTVSLSIKQLITHLGPIILWRILMREQLANRMEWRKNVLTMLQFCAISRITAHRIGPAQTHHSWWHRPNIARPLDCLRRQHSARRHDEPVSIFLKKFFSFRWIVSQNGRNCAVWTQICRRKTNLLLVRKSLPRWHHRHERNGISSFLRTDSRLCLAISNSFLLIFIDKSIQMNDEMEHRNLKKWNSFAGSDVRCSNR